jgi:hypothetical protein
MYTLLCVFTESWMSTGSWAHITTLFVHSREGRDHALSHLADPQENALLFYVASAPTWNIGLSSSYQRGLSHPWYNLQFSTSQVLDVINPDISLMQPGGHLPTSSEIQPNWLSPLTLIPLMDDANMTWGPLSGQCDLLEIVPACSRSTS